MELLARNKIVGGGADVVTNLIPSLPMMEVKKILCLAPPNEYCKYNLDLPYTSFPSLVIFCIRTCICPQDYYVSKASLNFIQDNNVYIDSSSFT